MRIDNWLYALLDEKARWRACATKMAEKITSLKLKGFSIELEEGPAILLMQTDKGPFSVEIAEEQLPHSLTLFVLSSTPRSH